MKTPREIYAQYKIMPTLQLHQLRVAGAAKTVCDHLDMPIDTHSVVLAGLFHDMGNIVKFDLSYYPDTVKPEGKEYWEGVKGEYVGKYGAEQHGASRKIAEEIGLPERVIEIIGNIGFSKMRQLVASDSYELKVCEYGDSRVTPYGIRSMDERWEDGRKRYLGRKDAASVARGVSESQEAFEALVALGHELEQQIFAHASIRPEEITDASVAPIIEELWDYRVV